MSGSAKRQRPRTLAYDDVPFSTEHYRRYLLVYVNGERHEIAAGSVEPTMTLLEWLRSIGLTGTKLGCAEGGCGACTVMVSAYDGGAVRHSAVNACLMPLCAADWCAVTTVEGIGSTRAGMHPVQDRMTQMHGSQCGFCTPGIVMSIYSLLRSSPSLTAAEMQEHLDGNLCRCTGYRPILDAARSLCSEHTGCGVNSEENGGCCGGGNSPKSCVGCDDSSAACHTKPADPTGRLLEDGDVVTSTEDKLAHFAEGYHASSAAEREPPFPAELADAKPTALCLPPAIAGGTTWWKPTSLQELLALKATFPDGRIVVGNSEVGIESRFKGTPCRAFISASAVPELLVMQDTQSAMKLGACAPLSDVERMCEQAAQARPGHEGEAARAIRSMLRWFASTQIRNVACLGGNIATASPISDMIPLLTACGATMTIASSRATRVAPLSAFFLGYRRVDLAADELIISVHVPHTRQLEFLRPFKQARRREDDISIVTGGLRVRLEAGPEHWTVAEATLAFGGLAPTVVTAPKAAAALVGSEWCAATVDTACIALQEELRISPSAPGGQPEYRGALAASALFKFFIATSVDLTTAAATSPPPPVVAACERTAGRSWVVEPKPSTRGTQRYPHASYPGLEAEPSPGITSALDTSAPVAEAARAGGVRVVGQSLPHAAGPRHTTGEAQYTDDAPLPPGSLHGWLVRAEQAPAILASISTSAAEDAPGVVRVMLAADLAADAHNSIGPISKDELCFAVDRVEHVGQVLGIVVAETAEQARVGAGMVQVTYGPPPPGVTPAYTIEEAIEAGSFFDQEPFDTRHDLESGCSVESALAEDGLVIVKGEFKMGGQEHFYLECNTTLALPTDDGGLEVLSSTQAVDKTQKMVARVCGLPCNKVVAKVRRMGGGFGGKETRSVFASCACAVAANALRRPVRLSLRRDVDMGTSGGRHPFLAKYTVAARVSPAGSAPQLVALDVQMYSNGGAMLDLSGPVMDRALLHVDNVYRWPAFRARGVVCRTHTPPNTAFRGFGGPQGMLITEAIMEHLAAELRVPVDVLRGANMYRDGDEVPFGQTLNAGDWRVPRAWAELRDAIDVDSRRTLVADFNRSNRWRKRGLAVVPTKFGINFTAKFMNQGGALVHVYTDGTVLISHGGTEMGQGLHTKVCQVAARAFGISLSACHVAETSTDKVANTIPTAASASTDLYCMATLDACHQILSRLKPLRARKPAATLAELALMAFLERIDLSAHGFFAIDSTRCGFDWTKRPGTKPDGTPDQRVRGHPFNYFTQGVAAVEVEIDVLTGDHEVLRADLLVDLGSSINPALDIGQIEGAFVQGMGWTTTEELIWGDGQHKWVRPGRLHTAGPGAYKLPAFNDTPREFNVRLMSGVDNRVAVHSSKAVGEPPFFLGATTFFAIRNAVAAAREEHLTSEADAPFAFYSPATTERIRLACGDRFAARAITSGDAHTGSLVPRGSF